MTFETYRLDGVELARTGTWEAKSGKFTMTVEHFQGAVAAAGDPEVSLPAIKFGHDSILNELLGDGAPSYGHIENVRLSADGNTLIGDLAGMPEAAAAVIGRAYKQRSVEMLIDVKTPSGREYKAALTGLALLGATAPAVKGLADLVPLFMAQADMQATTTPQGTAATVTLSDNTTLDTAYTGAVSDKTPPPAEKTTGIPTTKEKPTMATWTPTPEQLKLLGLDENATTEQIAEAVAAKLTAPADTPPADADKAGADKDADKDAAGAQTATDAEKVAASEGAPKTVTLSESIYNGIMAKLSALEKKDAARDNQVLLSEALKAGKIAAADKPSIEALLSASPEAGRKFLQDLKPGRVNMSERGAANAQTTVPDDDQARIDAAADEILKNL